MAPVDALTVLTTLSVVLNACVGHADVSSLPIGPQTLVVTATDALGRRGVAVVPFVHDPRIVGGRNNPPIGSK